MDLRRAGEFAFGSAVFLCGGAFLALAIGRLSAPVAGANSLAIPVVDLAPARMVAVAPLRHAPIASRAPKDRVPRIVLATKPAAKPILRIALAQKPRPASMNVSVPVLNPVIEKPVIAKTVDAKHVIAKPVTARPVFVAAPPRVRVARPAAAHTTIAPRMTIALRQHRDVQRTNIAAPQATKRAISPKRVARPATETHRYGIAYVRIRPKAERTPEPPIGYVDHPALVSSDGASQAAPTTAPVQVELETTHLAH